jgi:hypothetical protein
MGGGELKRALAKEVRMVYRFACAEPAFWGCCFRRGSRICQGLGMGMRISEPCGRRWSMGGRYGMAWRGMKNILSERVNTPELPTS